MRPAPVLVTVLCLLLSAPRLVLAQDSTADGIEAVIRTDPANPVTRFFLAALHEAGFDRHGDPILACAFYLSVASSPTPLAAPARAHVDTLRRENPDLADGCDEPIDRASGSVLEAASAATAVDGHETRAGVAAFIAGDYQAAATILRPIAERNRRLGVDAVASFFTAAMYHSGIGLPRDPLRACALYTRPGVLYSDTTTWFERLNAAMARDAYFELPEEQRSLCILIATIGFEHRFDPATFSLGPQHSVTLTLSGDGIEAAVTYRGREKREPVPMDRADGLVFLPLRYTELQARPPAVGSRHFVELQMWVPASSTSWRLDWTLVEIVGESAEAVAHESLIDSSDRDAPVAPLDVRSVVVVRNDDAGRAEWAVLTGPDARSELIPTRAERREIRQEEKARDERKAIAAPRGPLTFPRPPAFTYADADGCANLFAFASSADRAEVLTVRADADMLRLVPGRPRTFDLSAAGPDLEVEAWVSNRAGYDWGLCTDVRGLQPGDEDESWRAVSGRLTIAIEPRGIRVSQPYRYRASIRLSEAEFVGPTGMRVRLGGPITMTAWVGSIGGPRR